MIKHRIPTILQLPYLPIWLVPAILFVPMLATGRAIFWGTPFLQFVPWRVAAVEILKSGHLPLWNPWVGMGAPLLANYQSALLYPPNLLLLGLQAIFGTGAQAWGQGLILLAHLVWAGIGMAFWVRSMGIGKTGQSVAGLAFGVSTYLVARSGFLSINEAVSWLPWVMLATNRIASPRVDSGSQQVGNRKLKSVGLALAFGMQLLTGHAQTAWYTLVLAAAWVLVWGIRGNGFRGAIRPLLQFAAGIALAVGIAAIQLVPTVEYLLQSQRASEVGLDYALNYSFWPWHLLTLIAPDFFGSPVRGDYWFNAWFWEDAVYIGLLPLVVGLTGAVAVLFRRRPQGDRASQDDRRVLTIFLVVTIGISFLLALGRYTPIFPFLYRYVPTFNMFQAPARISLWAVVGLVLLGSLGVDRWRAPAGRALYWTRLSAAGGVAILIGAGAAWFGLRDLHATFIRAMALAGIWAVGTAALSLLRPKEDGRRSTWWSWAVVALLGADLIVANWGLQPSIPMEYYTKAAATHSTVQPMVGNHRIYADKQTLYDQMYIQYLLAENYHPGKDWEGFKANLLPNAALMDGISSSNNFDPLLPGEYAYWMEQMETLNPIERREMLKMMDVGAVERIDPYEEAGVRFDPIDQPSRYQWFGCAVHAKTNQEAWNALTGNKFAQDYPKTTQPVVILGNAVNGSSDCVLNGVAEINLINENPNEVILQVRANQAGWLFQADTWYPGWVARVDGKQQPIERANVNFRAVAVPAGVHIIDISYRPFSFYVGAILTLISTIGLIGWALRAA